MSKNLSNLVIPLERIPERRNRIITTDGKPCLVQTDWYGVIQERTAGENSRWLLALMEEAKIIGGMCLRCGTVVAPLIYENCANPPCRFETLTPIELPDIGHLIDAQPVITVFPPSPMHNQAPFCHGWVVLGDGYTKADTAFLIWNWTTQGLIRPGIYAPGEPVKLVFLPPKQRRGWMRDVVTVPTKELTAEQLDKKPLLTTDLDWSKAKVPPLELKPEYQERFPVIFESLLEFASRANAFKRSQDVLQRSHRIAFLTGGGNILMTMGDGKLAVEAGEATADYQVIQIADPEVLFKWATKAHALTNILFRTDCWMKDSGVIPAIFDLDRLPRAVWRAEQEKKEQ